MRLMFPWIVLSLLAACEGPAGQSARGEEASAPPAPTLVNGERTDLLFRYRTADGRMANAQRIEDVPAGTRSQVVVIDMGRSPESRGASVWVHVADLSSPDATGSYPVKVLLKRHFETSLRRKAEAATPKIIMYATSW